MVAENQPGNAGNLGGNTKKMRNQGVDAGNKGGILSIVVEITWNSNGNDKLKDWREVKNNKFSFTHLTWCLSC